MPIEAIAAVAFWGGIIIGAAALAWSWGYRRGYAKGYGDGGSYHCNAQQAAAIAEDQIVAYAKGRQAQATYEAHRSTKEARAALEQRTRYDNNRP